MGTVGAKEVSGHSQLKKNDKLRKVSHFLCRIVMDIVVGVVGNSRDFSPLFLLSFF